MRLHRVACRAHSSVAATPRRALPADTPSLHAFLASQRPAPIPDAALKPRSVYLENHGCAQNAADLEIVLSLLSDAGYSRTPAPADADLLLLNTCAIRDGAETKIWSRLDVMAKAADASLSQTGVKPVVGLLGCMAERLKSSLLEANKGIDVVVGPDAYRSLPGLVASVVSGAARTGIDTQLSHTETYADIVPMRADGLHQYVSIQRGCSNMCSFCVVPFTRGVERSLPASAVLDQVAQLVAGGVREITLLGQNVNSYVDKTAVGNAPYTTASGFTNMYRARDGPGMRFAELLSRVAAAAPDARIRFTSPHPKDFTDDVLDVIGSSPNIAKQVHLPAQSGSSAVLRSMRRGYTREAYSALAHRIRARVPGVGLSTDMIAGFCGESEADHAESVSLLHEHEYENAFLFAYSRRERTHAGHTMVDDVPQAVKDSRLQDLLAAFRTGAKARCEALVGSTQLVLVEGVSRKSTDAAPLLAGRADNGLRVLFPPQSVAGDGGRGAAGVPVPGEFVTVRVTGAGSTSLRGEATARGRIGEFF